MRPTLNTSRCLDWSNVIQANITENPARIARPINLSFLFCIGLRFRISLKIN